MRRKWPTLIAVRCLSFHMTSWDALEMWEKGIRRIASWLNFPASCAALVYPGGLAESFTNRQLSCFYTPKPRHQVSIEAFLKTHTRSNDKNLLGDKNGSHRCSVRLGQLLNYSLLLLCNLAYRPSSTEWLCSIWTVSQSTESTASPVASRELTWPTADSEGASAKPALALVVHIRH